MKNSGVDWKSKYVELRNMTKESMDVAWRMGYEQGSKDAKVDSMQQQMQAQQEQAQQMMQAQAQGHQQGADAAMQGQQAGADQAQEQQDQAQQPGNDEVGQAIGELEQIVNKFEGNSEQLEELKKSMDKIKNSHKVRSISFLLNAKPSDHKEISHQESIVEGVLKKWEAEESSAKDAAARVLEKLGK